MIRLPVDKTRAASNWLFSLLVFFPLHGPEDIGDKKHFCAYPHIQKMG